MNTSFKKIIAGVTAVTIVAMNMSYLTVNAANAAINGSTAANVATALTITNGGNQFVDANEITFASLKKLDGTAATTTVAGYAASAGSNNTSIITLSADPTGNADNNNILVVSFVTAGGDFGTAQLTVGTPTSNLVTVSANVVPTLSLTLANATVALGTLTTAGVNSATDPTATVATNATNGFTLTVDSTNDGLYSATADVNLTLAESTIEPGVVGGAAEGYALAVTETTDTQTNGSVVANPNLVGGAVTIASSTGPNVGYVATIDVGASISAITPAAADYTDTLTFTVTGSF